MKYVYFLLFFLYLIFERFYVFDYNKILIGGDIEMVINVLKDYIIVSEQNEL